MKKMITVECVACDRIEHDTLMDPMAITACVCGAPRFEIHWTVAKSRGMDIAPAQVVGDDIPGGLMIHHGICHENGEPKRYDTKSSIREAAKAKGLIWGMDHSEHVVAPRMGTDKSPHTVRCVAMPGCVTAEQEAERVRAWRDHEAQLQQELQEARG